MRLGHIVTSCHECSMVYEIDPSTPHFCDIAATTITTNTEEPT